MNQNCYGLDSSFIIHPSSFPQKRAMGFEPTTSCLEGRNSTAELHPRNAKPTDSHPWAFPQVGGEGFEPPNSRGGQIYSLVQ